MKIKFLPLLLLAGIVGSSCKKDKTFEEVENKSMSELTAPANFTWSGSRDVTMSIGISDNSFGSEIHVVKVYTADPAKGGELVSTGSATLVKPFNTKITLSSIIKEVYIEKIAPNGAVVGQSLTLTSDVVSTSLSATGIVANGKTTGYASKRVSVVPETAPTVPAGATVITPAQANWVSLPGNTVYEIRAAGTYRFNAFGQNATLYVNGTDIVIGNVEFQNNLTVIITSGSKVNFSGNFNWSGSNTFKNFGAEVSISNNVQPKGGTFHNQGPLTISKDFAASGGTVIRNTSTITGVGTQNFIVGSDESTSTLENSGTITVNSDEFQVKNIGTSIINTGTITATSSRMVSNGNIINGGTLKVEELHLNSGGKITNNCKWFITSTSFKNEINGPIENNSYFSVGNAININSGGKITLKNGALFVTKSIYDGFSEKITGSGTTSVLKITGTIPNLPNHSNSPKFSNALQVVYTSGTLPAGMFEGGAVQKAAAETVFIASGPCMEEGSGTANTDPDGDNVHGDLDKFPNDASRAYIIESQNYANGGYTVAFEDSWPLKGDYDLNDVVVNYKYKTITSSTNQVVELMATYRLIATGGVYKMGFGVEFPVAANKASITSATAAPVGSEIKLEDGQENAVLILFNNGRDRQLTWNTEAGVASSPVVEFNVTIKFANGPDQGAFGTADFNPFIFNSAVGNGRDYETHLFGKKPTSKANTSLFGTGNDASSLNGRLYGTAQNLPWGIVIPTAEFKYPLERASITSAYLKFANWAITGGTSSSDWYIGTDGSYRDGSKLYTKPN